MIGRNDDSIEKEGTSPPSSSSSPLSSSPPTTATTPTCTQCRKRVGAYGFTCKCAKLYCLRHLPAEKHECTYDYLEAHRQALQQANPRVVADKAPPFS